MLRKKFYIPIGVVILVICAIGLLFLRSQTPKEPIKVYKTTTSAEVQEQSIPVEVQEQSIPAEAQEQSTAGGHFHEEGTWQKAADTQRKTVSDVSEDQRLTEIAVRLGMPPDSTYNEIIAEVERREAEVAEKSRLSKEVDAIASAADEIVEALLSDTVKIYPILLMTYDEFHDTYPTVKDRREVAASLMEFERYRERFVSLIEDASPPIREAMYAEMEAQGTREQYQRLLKPLPIVDWLDTLIAEHAEPNGGTSK